jgi:hypothetical protein
MPTEIPIQEKFDFINVVKVMNPVEASLLPELLNNYEDIPNILIRQLDLYSSFPQYLDTCMAVFAASDSELIAVGIYVNKTEVESVVNPTVFVNSTTSGGVAITANSTGLYLYGSSEIDSIIVSQLKSLLKLYIGGGAKVSMLDATGNGALVNLINVKYQHNRVGELSMIKQGSNIAQLVVDRGAYFGGYGTEAPTNTCAYPVTDFVVENLQNNSLTLKWTLPSTWLYVNIYYRVTESGTWIAVDSTKGDYINDIGFVFKGLVANTSYDFRVIITCPNGGLSTPLETTQTTTV